MARAAQFRDPSSYVGGHPSPAAISAAKKRYWAKLSHEERVAQLTSFIAAGQATKTRAKDTRIELLVAETLGWLNSDFRRNVQIGSLNVDFLLAERVVIECYGDYWHCNPAVYAPTYYHRQLHLTAAEKWERDRDRVQRLVGMGYLVHVLWERDIRESAALTMNLLRIVRCE